MSETEKTTNQTQQLSPVQKANQDFLGSNPAINKQFKDIQRFAKKKDQFSTLASSVKLLESLTGKKGLSTWILAQFDMNF